MADQSVRYFVFDVESVADGELVAKVRYPNEGLNSQDAIARYRAELIQKTGSDFVPYTQQLPICVVVAKINANLRISDIVLLDEPHFRPHVITENFWRGWEKYGNPTLVTFNGRSFDIPLLEMSAFRYGITVPKWFATDSKSWEQPRNRYNVQRHLDLQDMLVNYGATKFSGGLNLAAHVLGKPGKVDVQGHMVQDLYDQGKLDQINDYCRCDVLDTYFVFLRRRVMIGRINLQQEQEIVEETKHWIEERSEMSAGYRTYLSQWGDWPNPWIENRESSDE